MTKDEQKVFIREHALSLMKEMIEDIDKGKIPEEWDGIELRWLFSSRSNTNFGQAEKKRRREFNNIVITKNL